MKVLCGVVLASSLLLVGPGCKRAAEALNETGAMELMAADAFIEQNALGTLSFKLVGDGTAKLLVRSTAGEVLKGGIRGELSFAPADGSAPPKSVELVQDPNSGLLEADGVELGSDLTEVKYALTVSGKPVFGSMALPKGGTKELAAAAERAPDEEKGPHEGVVQTINGERYELVADADSKQVRVYPLAPGQAPKAVQVHVDGEEPRVVVLERDPGGEYFAAPLVLKTHPRKLTLFVVDDHGPGAVVVGWHPRRHLVVVDHAPRYWVRRGWRVVELDRDHDHHTVLVKKGHQHKVKPKEMPPGHAKKHKHGKH